MTSGGKIQWNLYYNSFRLIDHDNSNNADIIVNDEGITIQVPPGKKITFKTE